MMKRTARGKKTGRKRANTPYDLKDSGEYYKSHRVSVASNGDIILTAQPQKEDTNLFKEYGPGILKLTDENLQVFANFLIPKIQDEVLKIILA